MLMVLKQPLLGPFVPKTVFRDVVAKARSYHSAKRLSQKLVVNSCLLRTLIFRIGKHVCLP